jgi:SAM-dependent methyltransferase
VAGIVPGNFRARHGPAPGRPLSTASGASVIRRPGVAKPASESFAAVNKSAILQIPMERHTTTDEPRRAPGDPAGTDTRGGRQPKAIGPRPAQPATSAAGNPHSARIKQHARAQFEKWAVSYDRSVLNELIFLPSVRACQEEIARWQAERGAKPFRMLDVGCGTGSLLTLLARDERAELLVGLDYAKEMVRRAADKSAASEHAEKLQVINGDSERLPLADQSFDIVTCCNSFHHYPHQAAAIREFRRVLRPGGRLVLIDGFRDNVVGWVVFDVAVALAEKHVHHASWSELRTMIREAGFDHVRQRKLNVLAPLLVSVADVAA